MAKIEWPPKGMAYMARRICGCVIGVVEDNGNLVTLARHLDAFESHGTVERVTRDEAAEAYRNRVCERHAEDPKALRGPLPGPG